MIIEQPSGSNQKSYKFKVQKKYQYKENVNINLHTKGIFSLEKNKSSRFDNSLDHVFKFKEFISKNVKEPLIFDTVKWIYNIKLDVAVVGGKDILEIEWKRFRDKYRKKENVVAFDLLESMYFKNLLGMEYSFLSNMPYSVFFVNFYNEEIKEESIFRGIDFMLMPTSIPLNTWYKCTKIDSQFLYLDGWVTLDNKFLEKLLLQKEFREHAQSYHFSKDFRVDSDIKVCIDSKSGNLHTASFKMIIDGEDGVLKDEMLYELRSNLNNNSNHNYIIGPLVEIDGR